MDQDVSLCEVSRMTIHRNKFHQDNELGRTVEETNEIDAYYKPDAKHFRSDTYYVLILTKSASVNSQPSKRTLRKHCCKTRLSYNTFIIKT